MTVVDGIWVVHHDDQRRIVEPVNRRVALDRTDYLTLSQLVWRMFGARNAWMRAA
jgi:hypothetical protein